MNEVVISYSEHGRPKWTMTAPAPVNPGTVTFRNTAGRICRIGFTKPGAFNITHIDIWKKSSVDLVWLGPTTKYAIREGRPPGGGTGTFPPLGTP